MGKVFSIFRLQLVILVVGVGIANVSAQTIQYLNSNNIVAGIGTGGELFSDSAFIIPAKTYINADLFQTKFDSGRSEIFSAALWMNGFDESGILHGVVGGYQPSYFDGPIESVYDNAYYNYYNRVFRITQNQITQFRSLNFPVNSNLIDSPILYWPGIGNPSVLNDYGVNIDSPLAPFIDVNSNGIYDPLQGDYPAFLGDQAVFFVFNDISGTSTGISCIPMGVEIRGLATCFTDTAPGNLPYNKRAINNSIFVQYEVENKSQHTYSGFDIGQWLDPDIGCFSNDFVGCDSATSLMFAYNATTLDPSCAPEFGYESLPVALGVQLLNQPMDVFGFFTGAGGIDLPSIDTACSDFRNYLEGLWSNGDPFEYGGYGYQTGGYVTKFVLSGDPTDTSEWSEVSSHNEPSDRRMYGATDSLSLVPSQTIHFDVGFTTSFDSNSNNISIVDSLKRDAGSIRNFYNNTIIPAQQVLAIKQIPPNNQFTVSVYPNPAHSQVTIMAGDNIGYTELTDIAGRVITRKTVGAKYITLPVSELAKGVYLVTIQSGGNTVVKKIVVE